MTILHIVEWSVVVALVACVYLFIRRQYRKTDALRQAVCRIMGLPENTPMKRFKEMHRQMFGR